MNEILVMLEHKRCMAEAEVDDIFLAILGRFLYTIKERMQLVESVGGYPNADLALTSY